MKADYELPARLREMRTRKGWTLNKAAEASGVHLAYISAVENVKKFAGPETLSKLAEAYAREGEAVDEVLKDLLDLRASDEKLRRTRLKERMKPIHLVLKNQGIFGEKIFQAITSLRRKEPKRSQFAIIENSEAQEVDWETREVGSSAVIRLDGKNYRVRLMVSEEPDPDSSK